MPQLIDENQQFIDPTTGALLNNGYIYIGTKGADPVNNPITIYSDRDLTTTLSNPQRTGSDGRVENKIWIPGRYSIKVENSNNVQKLEDLDAGENPATGTTSLVNVQGTNTITAEASPAITELVDSQIYLFRAANDNTGATTLQIDSTSAKNIYSNNGALLGGEILGDSTYIVVYNSTNDVFDLQNITIKDNLNATAAPGTGDDSADGYSVGSRWIDRTNDNAYVCVDATASAAVWRPESVIIGALNTPTSTDSVIYAVPSTVKKITIMLTGLSTDNTGNIFVRLGDAGGIETSGYVGGVTDGDGGAAAAFSANFTIVNTVVAARLHSGIVELCLVDAATFSWAEKSIISRENNGIVFTGAGYKALSAAITQVEVGCATGDFDAGSVNIQYE